MFILSAALLAALSVALLLPAPGAVRTRLATPTGEESSRSGVRRVLLPLGAGLFAVWIVGGLVGWVLAVGVAGFLARRGATQVSEADRTRATRRALELPVAIDLLASCLLVGAAPSRALREVAGVVAGSLADDIRAVADAMESGAAPDEAWALVEAADLQSVASLMRRTSSTGASVAPLLSLLAEQHRQQARLVALDAARTLGVRATGPLGLCFLPAFVLVAVVPLVVSLLPWDALAG